MDYKVIQNGQLETVVAHYNSELLTADSNHANFSRIVEALEAQEKALTDAEIAILFDHKAAIAAKAVTLSNSVSVLGNKVYFDGTVQDTPIAKHILRLHKAGQHEDIVPLVAFWERVQLNPQEHSREQLLTWLATEDFSITPDGLIVGYKAVIDKGDGLFSSTASGPGNYVNGVPSDGYVLQRIGDTVSMDRGRVAFNPAASCSVGLHVGNWKYVKGYYGHNPKLIVLVDPADVCSVPTDSDWSKMRVCRYVVVDTTTDKRSEPVVRIEKWDALNPYNRL